MNNMLIDLQVVNFLSAWSWWDKGYVGRCENFNIFEKLTDEEFFSALEIAKRKYKDLNK